MDDNRPKPPTVADLVARGLRQVIGSLPNVTACELCADRYYDPRAVMAVGRIDGDGFHACVGCLRDYADHQRDERASEECQGLMELYGSDETLGSVQAAYAAGIR